jgi:hypothetical protein
MADLRPEALSLDRLHCGGGAAMTAERARCDVYLAECRFIENELLPFSPFDM